MPRCPKCNKKVDRLYNNRCTGCMSESIIQENSELDAMLNEISPELVHKTGDLNKPGGFAKAFQRSESEKKRLEELKSKKVQLTSKSDKVYERVIAKAGLSDKEKKAYMPSLKQLFKKYEPMFLKGEYRLCKKADYGKDEFTGGTVVDMRGGIVVYKDIEYYDENRMVVDPYAADDVVIYSADDVDNESINQELGIEVQIDGEDE